MKHLSVLSLLIFLAIISLAADQAIKSSVYDWEKLLVKKTSSGEVRNILHGPTRSLEMFDIKAISLNPGGIIQEYNVEKGFDELLIIKEGSAGISVNGVQKILSEGSIVVACQGDKVKISNMQSKTTTFYSFMFKPVEIPGINRPIVNSPIMKDWNLIEFKANANGGRRDILKQPTSTMKELEMHTTTLNEGLPSHAAHTHPDEEIILVRFGIVEQTINGNPCKLGPGSVIFLTNDDNHGISNAGNGKCEYYAIRWLTYSATAPN
jgi:quercetin dioxygenase-like cupin family protein